MLRRELVDCALDDQTMSPAQVYFHVALVICRDDGDHLIKINAAGFSF